MVHVEIQDRDASIAVRSQRMRGADSDVVEQAKAHGLVALGMVSGRPDRAERVVCLAQGDEIHGCNDGAGGAPGGIKRARADHGIRIESSQAVCRHAGMQRIDVRRVVHP